MQHCSVWLTISEIYIMLTSTLLFRTAFVFHLPIRWITGKDVPFDTALAAAPILKLACFWI